MTHHRHPIRKAHGNEAFTMVVIAALFIAFATVAAVLVERNTATQFITRRDATAAQLSRLANAIIQYGVFNSSGTTMLYPCPAQDNLLTTSANFGLATNPVGTTPVYPQACSSTTGDTASATTYGISIMGTDVIRGMVPVQTLAQYGIGINDAFDPWNNRIEYVVNRKLTVGSVSPSFTNNPTISYPYLAAAQYPRPDFILISYGRDSVGAIKRNAITAGITCPASSTYFRLINCGVTTTYTLLPTYTASSAVTNSATTSSYFDDILTFYGQ